MKENEGKQSVTYSLNPEKIGTSKEFFKQMKETIRDERKNKKKFFDYPEKKQVQIVLKELIGRKLNEIKAYVDYRLNPTFDKQLAFMFWTNPLHLKPESWMADECAKNREYRKSVFKIFDQYLKP